MRTFENQNPQYAVDQHYNVYSNVDTEAPRYLEFERFWGRALQPQRRRDRKFNRRQLFVGNKLAAGRIETSYGTAVDLRISLTDRGLSVSNVGTITPPQQALDCILDST